MTIGIGDGGNEIGFGHAEAALKEALPIARACGCPCAGGIADATDVSVCVTAATSNWGAYAIMAALAMLQERRKALPRADLILDSVMASIDAGAHDGYSGLAEARVDGTDLQTSLAIYDLCLALVDHAERLP